MKRRDFVRSLAIGSGISCMTPSLRVHPAPQEYQGRFLVVMQMDGAWDVTSLCDPKTNVPGEREINNWARVNDIDTAGRIAFAPFASNERLFQNHHQRMLIVNGVDAQTNAHSTGVLHNWSGRNAAGLPSLTAMFAASQSPDLPLAYVNFGGFADTARLIRYSRLDDHEALIDLLNPTTVPWDDSRSIRTSVELERVSRYQKAALERKLVSNTLTPRQRENINAYLNARNTRETLQQLLDILPPASDFFPDETLPGTQLFSNLMRQIQLTLLTFKAGVGSASDLFLSGFDTHTTHDSQHRALFDHLADAIDYFWNYADTLGISNRITLVIGSDFGRTPFYNADQGKDHWPIGSYIIMEDAPAWGDRMVGATDEGHNALKIDASSLEVVQTGGVLLHPKHVHQALRTHLGIDSFASSQQLGFGALANIDMFNPNKWT